MSMDERTAITCTVDEHAAPTMHTHLLCPDCASETVKNGYASHWWCEACGAPNAQAVIVCSPVYGQKVVGDDTNNPTDGNP